MNRAPGLLRFVAALAVTVAIAQSIAAPAVVDATGALLVLIAAVALHWIAGLWESLRERPAPATAARVTRRFAQPVLIGVLVWILAAGPPAWQSALAGALALAAPAAALGLVRLAESGTAPADR